MNLILVIKCVSLSMLSINNTTDFTTPRPQMKWGTSSLIIKTKNFSNVFVLLLGSLFRDSTGMQFTQLSCSIPPGKDRGKQSVIYHFLPFSSFTEESECTFQREGRKPIHYSKDCYRWCRVTWNYSVEQLQTENRTRNVWGSPLS